MIGLPAQRSIWAIIQLWGKDNCQRSAQAVNEKDGLRTVDKHFAAGTILHYIGDKPSVIGRHELVSYPRHQAAFLVHAGNDIRD